MKNIGIFYGSDTGSTQEVAELLAKKLNVDKADLFDVGSVDSSKLSDYETLILGSSTQGYGDLQSDWDDFLGKLKSANLAGKKVGVFGLGDSASYSDTFCDAMGTIADAVVKAGATLIANKVDVSDYSYDDSISVKDGFFVGLALDQDNESDKTENRINSWLDQLKAEL